MDFDSGLVVRWTACMSVYKIMQWSGPRCSLIKVIDELGPSCHTCQCWLQEAAHMILRMVALNGKFLALSNL